MMHHQRIHQRIQRAHDASTIAHAYNFRESHEFHVYSFMMLMVNPYNLYRVEKHVTNIKILFDQYIKLYNCYITVI